MHFCQEKNSLSFCAGLRLASQRRKQQEKTKGFLIVDSFFWVLFHFAIRKIQMVELMLLI